MMIVLIFALFGLAGYGGVMAGSAVYRAAGRSGETMVAESATEPGFAMPEEIKPRRRKPIAVIVDEAPIAPISAPEATSDLLSRLIDRGVAKPIAVAASKHAIATLGQDAAIDSLVNEALRVCPARKAA